MRYRHIAKAAEHLRDYSRMTTNAWQKAATEWASEWRSKEMSPPQFREWEEIRNQLLAGLPSDEKTRELTARRMHDLANELRMGPIYESLFDDL